MHKTLPTDWLTYAQSILQSSLVGPSKVNDSYLPPHSILFTNNAALATVVNRYGHVANNLPHCGTCGGRWLLLNKFFSACVDTCLNWEDSARQSCAMVPRWRFFASFLRPVFPASLVQHISELHSKFALRPHHLCRSMVDIHSATAEIRRKKRRRKEDRARILGQCST